MNLRPSLAALLLAASAASAQEMNGTMPQVEAVLYSFDCQARILPSQQ